MRFRPVIIRLSELRREAKESRKEAAATEYTPTAEDHKDLADLDDPDPADRDAEDED